MKNKLTIRGTIHIEILWLAIAGMLVSSCGTRDYRSEEAEEVSHQEVSQKVLSFLEEAYLAKEAPLEISVGELDLEDSSRIPMSSSCPSKTVCLRGKFFGINQMQKLHETFPNDFLEVVESSGTTFRFNLNNKPVQVEADIVEVPENITLDTNGSSVVLVSSFISGRGLIRSTPVQKDHKSGDISLFASEISELSLDASAQNLTLDKLITETPIRNLNGDASLVKIEPKISRLNQCIYGRCFGESFENERNEISSRKLPNVVVSKDLEAQYKNALVPIFQGGITYDQVLDLRKQENEWVKKTFNHKVDRYFSPHGEREHPDSFKTGCYLRSYPERGDSGFVYHGNFDLSSFETLHGKDAKVSRLKSSDIPNEKEGRITVRGSKLRLGKISSRSILESLSKEPIFEEPGKPAKINRIYPFEFHFKGTYECDRIGIWVIQGKVNDFKASRLTTVFSFPVEFKISLKVDLASLVNSSDFQISDEFIEGKDGKDTLQEERERLQSYKKIEPSIITLGDQAIIKNEVKMICSNCSLPKVFQ